MPSASSGGALGAAARQVLCWARREMGGDWAVALSVSVGLVSAVFGAKRVSDRGGVGLDAAAVAAALVTGFPAALLEDHRRPAG